MFHNPAGVPGVVLVAQDAIETEYPALHRDATRAFQESDFFREVKYGAGRQLLPQLSQDGFAEYVEMATFVYDNHELMEDMDLHNYLIILGVFGILSPKHLATIADVSLGALRKNLVLPKGCDIRIGGKLNASSLREVTDVLETKESDGELDYGRLVAVRDAGTSITLLSRMTGIGAQTLARRFRKGKENETDARTDSTRKAQPHTGGHSQGSSPVPPAGYEDPITGPDDPRLKIPQPLYSWNPIRGRAQLTFWGHKAGLGEPQEPVGKAGRDGVAAEPTPARSEAAGREAGSTA